jgi:hypothetical protein
MIGLSILITAQAATPELRTEVTRTSGPEFTAEIAPMVNRYYECLIPSPGITWTPSMRITEEQMFRDRISLCDKTRLWAVSGAIAAYRPKHDGDETATDFVTKTFDAIDQVILHDARSRDRFAAGDSEPASQSTDSETAPR